MTPFIKHYCNTILPSPTGASDEETHFIPPFGWPEIMHIASDVQHQGRVASKQWGDVEILSCTIENQPHILAHIRTIQGTPFEGGFAWHRETLKAELNAIKSPLEIAGAAVFFGDTALELFSEPLDAPQPSSGRWHPKRSKSAPERKLPHERGYHQPSAISRPTRSFHDQERRNRIDRAKQDDPSIP